MSEETRVAANFSKSNNMTNDEFFLRNFPINFPNETGGGGKTLDSNEDRELPLTGIQ
jgi:hypothetical protein